MITDLRAEALALCDIADRMSRGASPVSEPESDVALLAQASAALRARLAEPSAPAPAPVTGTNPMPPTGTWPPFPTLGCSPEVNEDTARLDKAERVLRAGGNIHRSDTRADAWVCFSDSLKGEHHLGPTLRAALDAYPEPVPPSERCTACGHYGFPGHYPGCPLDAYRDRETISGGEVDR